MRFVLLALLPILAAAFLRVDASARTFLIQPGPTAIQDAVAHAVEPDTVLLSPGRYIITKSTIVLRRPITLMSSGGPAVTVIDKQYDIGPVMWITAMVGGPTIKGLTIARGANAFTAAGGGIYCENASPTIVDNVILANAAGNIDGGGGWGGGVAIVGGSPTIQHNTFIANEAGFGALYLERGSGTVDHNVIAYNQMVNSAGPDTVYGYGYSCFSSAASVHDNIFWANHPGQVDPHCGELLGVDGNIELDPRFCNPLYGPEGIQGDWNVRLSSPIAPGHPYYGWGAPLGTCATTDGQPTTWGSVKARYR